MVINVHSNRMPSLTVVICTHNRADLLCKCLASLDAAQRPDGWEISVLVVANACSDHTHRLLGEEVSRRRYGEGLPLTWITEPRPGKSHALNRATALLDSEWVAFVDDDHRVDANWLLHITAGMQQQSDIAMLCGRILPDWDGSEPSWVHDQGPYRIYPLPIPCQDFGEHGHYLTSDVTLPGGGNLCVRREWFARVGPFDTNLGPSGHNLGGAEDVEWIKRALTHGARLWYVPEAVQYHFVDPARLKLMYLMTKAYKRSATAIQHAAESSPHGVPPYLYRKLAEYGLKAVTALTADRRRFYLVRTAAALGEIAGHRRHGRPRTRPQET